MIHFNDILAAEGIEPEEVKLVRHKDNRSPEGVGVYDVWLAEDGRFELYQRLQHRMVFANASMLASFVVTPTEETLFVGMYDVAGVGKASPGTICPVTSRDVGTGSHNLYSLNLSQKLDDYRGRLIIEWGPGYRSWVQLAAKQNKMVSAILKSR
jgi:hypothetical protein